MKKKIYFAALLIVFNIFLFFVYKIFIFMPTLFVEISTEKDTVLQVFYLINSYEGGYSEKDSKKVQLSGNDKIRTISFKIPQNTDITRLRLDFGESLSVFYIRSMYVQGFITKTIIPVEKIPEIFIIRNDIVGLVGSENNVKITTNGSDSFFVSNSESFAKYSIQSRKIQYVFKHIFLWCQVILSILTFCYLQFFHTLLLQKNLYAIFFLKYQIDSKIIDLSFFFVLTVCFFSLVPVITFDGIWYHTYLDIFNGTKPITAWDPTRGFPFPFIIFLSTKFFGYTAQGIMLTMYIFYISSVIGINALVKKLGLFSEVSVMSKWLVLTIFLYINPLFLGYFHLVLTEFVATTVYILFLNTMISVKFYTNTIFDKKVFLKKIITVAVFTALAYYIKQMFAALILLSFVALEIIQIIYCPAKKNIIKKCMLSIFIFVFSLFFLSSLNGAWDKMIDAANARDVLGRKFDINATFSNGLMSGLRYFKIESEVIDSATNTVFQNVIVIENQNEIGTFFFEKANTGVANSIKYIISCFANYPAMALKSYFDSFMITINVYHLRHGETNIVSPIVIRDFSLLYAHENDYHGMYNRYINLGDMFYSNEYANILNSQNFSQYHVPLDKGFISKIINSIQYVQFANFCFTVINLFSFIILVISLIKIKHSKMRFLFLFSFVNFFYIITLVLIGSTIDRYLFPIYFTEILMLFLVVGECSRWIKKIMI